MAKSKKFKIDQAQAEAELNNGLNLNGDVVKKDKKGKKKDKDEEEKKDEGPKLPPVSYFSLFRFATSTDKLFLVIAIVAAIGAGASMPAMVILFGEFTDAMVDNANGFIELCNLPKPNETTTLPPDGEDPTEKFLRVMRNTTIYMLITGTCTLIALYTFVSLLNRISEQQIHRIRRLYLEALLRQNVGWYDTNQDKNFVSRISEDLMKVGEAINEKLGLCIFFMSTFVLSIANAFWHGWLLTLVVLSSAPVLAIATGIVAGIQSRLVATEQKAYAKAGTVAEEALSNIRTVMAFSGKDKEINRYKVGLAAAKQAGQKRAAIGGFGVGLMWLVIYASYSLAFYYGSKLVFESREEYCAGGDPDADQDYSASNLLIVFFSVLMGAFNIGQSASYFESFATGRGSAASIFAVIDRTPEIDSYSEKGKKPSGKAKGKITFQNLKFSYPSRAEVEVLKNFTVTIQPGQTVAFVGHSGCGKSTCLQLLQRFYDPLGGKILVDDVDIRDLHLGWLRGQIGTVSQEPVLFNTTIRENIRYGREGATDKEIEEAAKNANAHIFISKLPSGYDTIVGDRGAQLSGGQKQRVAIARALVRNPSILLLDEATSALDTQSEAVVQAALDRASSGRTTLIVAHRLSTIRQADVVISINNGEVAEIGNHFELLAAKGLYFDLVTAQLKGQIVDKEEEKLIEEDLKAPLEEIKKKPLEKQYSVVRSMSITEDEEIVAIPAVYEDELSEVELAKQAPVTRLMALNKPEWKIILLGCIMAVIQGCLLPFYAILFSEVLGTLSDPKLEEAKKDARFYSLLFLIVGIVAGIAQFVQLFSLGSAGEKLTMRLRLLSFKAMLEQEMGYYDDQNNNVGALSSRLSSDAAAVQGAAGSRIGTMVQAIATLGIAMGVAFYFQAKLAAVCLAFVPVVLVASYFEGLLMTGQNILERKSVEDASKIAVQSVSNIRTVASLCREKKFVEMFCNELSKPHKVNLKRSHLRGIIFGVAQSMPLYAYSAVMYYGSVLIDKEDVEYENVFKVTESLIFGTMMIGQTMAFAPNYYKAKVSGARIMKLLDRKPQIDSSSAVGLRMNESNGNVGFDSVTFNYPTRPTAKILNGLSLNIKPGESIALVGPSGCGKSTTIQLILRFYDPLTGTVKLDDQDIGALNIDCLRKQMAIVAQEPALFDRTLAENIAYGDNSRKIDMNEIIESAKMANIHSFIAGLPSGYETRVGEAGTQLSGGQKQRVAIARALIRKPKVLLLDEATSALDTESEAVVQQALEKAAEGRTSITIAHRLSSIKNSDRIIVINSGAVLEVGTHSELLQLKGLYHKLWNIQGSNEKHS